MKKIILVPALLSTAMAAHAEDKAWSGEGELGYTMTSSAKNTESSSLVGKLGINYKNGRWGNELQIENVRTKTTDAQGATDKTADRSTVTDKLTYDINDSVYALANAKYEDDEFSAYHYQQNLTLGLGWHAIKNDSTKLDFEIGAGGQRVKLRPTATNPNSVEQNGGAGRFLERFSHKLTETTNLTQSLLSEGNGDNVQTTFDLGLKVAINGSMALKLSHQVKHNSDVPANTKHYDRTSTATLVYGF